jgi:hypothetical protein
LLTENQKGYPLQQLSFRTLPTWMHAARRQNGVKYCGRSRGAKAPSEAKIKLSHKRLMLICYNLAAEVEPRKLASDAVEEVGSPLAMCIIGRRG